MSRRSARRPGRARCVVCSAPIDSKHGRRFCDDRCRAEAGRLMAILTGAADAVYPSLADRLAAVGRVDATKRPRTSGDCGPLERLLTAAGLERRRDGGER